MRIGLIGTGRIGSFHAGVLARHPEVDTLVVTDTDRARAAEVADRIGATTAAGAAEVFGTGVDAVVIASATAAHAELIGQAAQAGLPAFCEKPIALDLPGTLSTLCAVDRAGSILQLGFMRRFDAGYKAARAAVQAGELGRLHTVRAMTMDPAPPPATYLPLSGGLYRDCLIHDFDMLRWVTGREVTEVYATGSDAGPEIFRAAGDVDTAAALLTLDDGTLATATATRCNGAGYDVRMELAGELDQITVGLDDRTPVTSAEPQGPAAPLSPWPGFLERFAPAYEAELDAFVRVVRGELPNPCDGREGWYALLVAEACEVSRRKRRPVEIAEIADKAAARSGARTAG
jgi:myo-inositol 2-dehydrogenase/D-chiro-inositol 1-dehydrogenase